MPESVGEPVWRALVAAYGFDLLPSTCFCRTQALVGRAREPSERDAFGADGRLLLADKRGHLCFDFLAAASALPAEDRVREPGDFLLNGFRKGPVGTGQ